MESNYEKNWAEHATVAQKSNLYMSKLYIVGYILHILTRSNGMLNDHGWLAHPTPPRLHPAALSEQFKSPSTHWREVLPCFLIEFFQLCLPSSNCFFQDELPKQWTYCHCEWNRPNPTPLNFSTSASLSFVGVLFIRLFYQSLCPTRFYVDSNILDEQKTCPT